MRANVRFWLALSLLLVAGVVFVRWKERTAEIVRTAADAERAIAAANVAKMATARGPELELLTTEASIAMQLASKGQTTTHLESKDKTNHTRFRLSNTTEAFKTLQRRDSAILMRNALIDTRAGVALNIPEHLKAGENPGAYIVQSRGEKAGVFQQFLKDAGAEIVAYVPNNAYLVKASAETAATLNDPVKVQSVMPYEPYFKIDTRLMQAAIDQTELDPELWLRVTLFPGADFESLRPLAREVGIREQSPFGEQVLIHPGADVLANLALAPEVQLIEPVTARVVANDLTRVRMGISDDPVTNTTYLNLRGQNVILNINDFGVDGTHPDLAGKVLYQGTNATRDFDGHGTHVAATIIGAGLTTNVFDNLGTNTDRLSIAIIEDEDGNPISTNVVLNGSPTNAHMTGMAPDARLFALPIDFMPDVNWPVTDSYLIESAARSNYFTFGKTNTMISNNSWNYANATDYDSMAARFDAATRDAVMGATGPQPVLYLFAAGNNGFGDEEGQGGDPGQVASPGTAKNVLTIGALEHPRLIQQGLTNITTITNEETQPPTIFTNTNVVKIFLPTTDSQNQVASYSSRGNVGIGIEGDYGRFKPDLVAPGTFILSAKSRDWNLTNDFNPAISETISNIYNVVSNVNSVTTLYRYDSGTSFSVPAVSGLLALVQEFFSQRLPDGLKRNLSPAMMKALLINSARNTHERYDYEVKSAINYQGWGSVNIRSVLSSNMLTEPEKDWSTQMVEQSPTNAVATGEGVAWDVNFTTNSQASALRVTLVWTDPPGNPATGVKLVNDLDLVVEAGGFYFHGNDFLSGRTRTENREPDFDTLFGDSVYRDSVNNVENVIIPGGMGTNVVIHVLGRRVNVKAIHDVFDKTGELNEIKQDFALVVESDYRGVDTNDKLVPPFTRFERRPNKTPMDQAIFRPIIQMTNGVPLLNQRVGANPPLFNTNGAANQWRFYVFTNNNNNVDPNLGLPPAGRYVAFVTFTPPNLSITRNLEADLDLYVSRDPELTNLNPAVLNGPLTWKSRQRLGTEQVTFAPTLDITNQLGQVVDRAPAYNELTGGTVENVANVDDVFYIAVKSEDQQAAEFSLISVSSQQPFEQDRNGIRVLAGMPALSVIPDGFPNRPRAASMVAIGLSDRRTLDASVFLTLSHEEYGDLVGVLRHNSVRSILNNHTLFDYNFTGLSSFIFSDDPYLNRTLAPDSTQYPFTTPPLSPDSYAFSDGPGFLANYAGQKMTGPWIFDMIDNAFSHTGRVERLEVHIKPVNEELINGETINGSVQPNGQTFYVVDIPANGARVTFTLRNTSGTQPLRLLVRKDLMPTLFPGGTDYEAVIIPPATSLQLVIDGDSAPPLTPGEYFVGIINPNAQLINFELTMLIELDSSGLNVVRSGNSDVALTDDAVTKSIRHVTNDVTIAEAAVRIVAENMRVSDYVFHLVSPQGTRVILSENRGRFSPDGFGSTVVTTNALEVFNGPSYAIFTDDPAALLPIKFVPPPFGDSSTNRGLVLSNSFEGVAQGDHPATAVVDGWTVTTGLVSVATAPAPHTGANFINLGNDGLGAIRRTLPTVQGRSYMLSVAYRGRANTAQPSLSRMRLTGLETNEVTLIATNEWKIFQTEFAADSDDMTVEFFVPRAPTPYVGLDLDTFVLIDTGTLFMQPEEPLEVLEGQRAMGEWRLDAWDNRTGQTATIKDWQVLISGAPAVLPAEQLEKGIVFPTQATNSPVVAAATYMVPGTVRRGETHYFYYDVCSDATTLTIEVRPKSGNTSTMDLMVDRSGFPTGDPARDDYVVQKVSTNTPLTMTLYTNAPAAAPLVQGQRIFIGVRNSTFFRQNSFELVVTSDGSCTIAPPAVSPIKAAKIASDGKFEVSFSSTPGTSYDVSVSTDLSNWTTVKTITATGTETTFKDTDPATLTKRFFRIKPLN